MRALALLRKEWLIIWRNPHALAVLFIMPTLFVVIMAMAMANISLDRAPSLNVELHLASDDSDSRFFATALAAQLPNSTIRLRINEQTVASPQAQVRVPAEFSANLLTSPALPLELIFPATTDRSSRQYLRSSLQIALAQTRLMAYWMDTGELDPDSSLQERLTLVSERTDSPLLERDQLSNGDFSRQANSTQHNVAAWLIFGMFFIMLPIGNSFQREQQSGALLRLRCMGLGLGHLVLAKLPAYFMINLLQFALLLAVGIWVLPLLSLPALQLPGSFSAYLLLAMSLSLAACSLGLAIAAVARSAEQAMLLSGGLNILLAALGGIMVPKSFMPESMRQLAELSPMSWGLDAFLTLLVGHGDSTDIAPLCLRLLVFAAISCSLGLFLFHRRLREIQWTTQY